MDVHVGATHRASLALLTSSEHTMTVSLHSQRRPRVLVTGFGIFPGAPLNPTERLIPLIAQDAKNGRFDAICHIQTEVLPVSYKRVPVRLEELCAECSPDITIHFGLSAKANAITLENQAKNEIRPSPDADGHVPDSRVITPDGPDYLSTLPLTSIKRRLQSAGIPCDSSDDAGGYLCNFVFYLSRSAICKGLRPSISGFIHVPNLGEAWTVEKLRGVAAIAIEEACTAWARDQPSN